MESTKVTSDDLSYFYFTLFSRTDRLSCDIRERLKEKYGRRIKLLVSKFTNKVVSFTPRCPSSSGCVSENPTLELTCDTLTSYEGKKPGLNTDFMGFNCGDRVQLLKTLLQTLMSH